MVNHFHGKRKNERFFSLPNGNITTRDMNVVVICDITYHMIMINLHAHVFELSVVLLQK